MQRSAARRKWSSDGNHEIREICERETTIYIEPKIAPGMYWPRHTTVTYQYRASLIGGQESQTTWRGVKKWWMPPLEAGTLWPSQLAGPSARGYMNNRASRNHRIAEPMWRASVGGGVWAGAMAGAWEVAGEKESHD
jgi:hypothetical protein